MQRFVNVLVPVVVCALVVAACGGAEGEKASGGKKEKAAASQSSGGTKVDPCELLTKEEVAAAIGEAVTKTDSGAAQEGSKFCHWYGNEDKLLSKGISLIVATDNGKERYKGFKDLETGTKPVEGIGDEAYTNEAEKAGVTLYEGDVFLRVTPVYNDAGVTFDATKSLAEKALARAKG